MANTKRREKYTDRSGNMFIPMNVEGTSWDEHFINTTKLFCILGIILGYILLVIYLGTVESKPLGYVILLGAWTLVTIMLVRFVIFEEKFYYRMYKELKQNEVCTPALFWGIASIEDTDQGAIITYSDGKIAIMVKVDRDTITGKKSDFQEKHYDTLSDFYRALAQFNYSFVQMNIMEQAGNDPRLKEFTKLINKSDNSNIRKLMENEIGYIKNVTRNSLYETDYFLVYTTDMNRADHIIEEVSNIFSMLREGAYVGHSILTHKGINDFVKQEYGVEYFNSTEASLYMFRRLNGRGKLPFNISGIIWTDGVEQNLNQVEINKVRNLASSVVSETVSQGDVSFKKAVYRKDIKKEAGVDFESLNQVNVRNNRSTIKQNVTNNSINNKPNEDSNKPSGSDNNAIDEDAYIDF